MKADLFSIKLFMVVAAIFASTICANSQTQAGAASTNELYVKLAAKDSLMFNAVFNTCDMGVIESTLADGYEFYQDKGQDVPDVTQDRKAFIESIQKNFCNENKDAPKQKMRREIEAGTLRLYPISGNEVVQTGIQHFYALDNGGNATLVEVSRFTRTWSKQGGDWKMTKEFDVAITTFAKPLHDALYDTIAQMDSILFDAYNRHDLGKIKTLFTNDLEFYHDKGGLTNYEQNMSSFKETFDKNNGITRTLVPGSLQVYPVPNFGAMEIGSHTFCHKENGKDDCGTFQFAMVWQKKDGQWKLSRVLSYGHRN